MKNAFVLNDVTKFEFYCKMFVNYITAEAMYDCYTEISVKSLPGFFLKITLWHFKNKDLQHVALHQNTEEKE